MIVKMNRRGRKGLCGRKPVASPRWREQKEGGDKGMSEREECTDWLKDAFHGPCYTRMPPVQFRTLVHCDLVFSTSLSSGCKNGR